MKMIPLWSLLISLVLLSCNDRVSDEDKAFLALAGSSGIMEVEMGNLAIRKATRPELIQFGQLMVAEHTSFNNEYLALCKKLKVEATTAMNPLNKAMVEELAKLSGDDFNIQYVESMISDHQLAVQKFEEAYATATDADYIAFLAKGMDIVNEHYEMAKELPK